MSASTDTDPGSTVLVTGGTGFLGGWVVARLPGADRRIPALCRAGRLPVRGHQPLTGGAGQAVIGFQDAARGHDPGRQGRPRAHRWPAPARLSQTAPADRTADPRPAAVRA
jgi:hypothetical protein